MIQSRRNFIRNLFVAPAIVAASNIMPVKALEWITPEPEELRPFIPLQMLRVLPGGESLKYDPVQISLIRRQAPNLVAYDLIGVQPMTANNGEIFALRSRYVLTKRD